MNIHKFYSISLKRQPYRRAAQIGALEVMGYPLDDLQFVDAYDFHDYDNEEFIDIAIEKGYLIYEKVKDFPEDSDFRRYDGCILLSDLLALEKIVEDDKPSIVLEDDAYFKVKYERLCLHLESLWNALPEPPEIVMLSFNPDISIHADCQTVPGTAGYFVGGAMANGFVATVFTPTGAARILDYHRHPDNQIHSMECCLQLPFGKHPNLYSVSKPDIFIGVSSLQGGSVQGMYEATSAGRTDAYLGFGRTLETNAARLRKYGLAKG